MTQSLHSLSCCLNRANFSVCKRRCPVAVLISMLPSGAGTLRLVQSYTNFQIGTSSQESIVALLAYHIVWRTDQDKVVEVMPNLLDFPLSKYLLQPIDQRCEYLGAECSLNGSIASANMPLSQHITKINLSSGWTGMSLYVDLICAFVSRDPLPTCTCSLAAAWVTTSSVMYDKVHICESMSFLMLSPCGYKKLVTIHHLPGVCPFGISFSWLICAERKCGNDLINHPNVSSFSR